MRPVLELAGVKDVVAKSHGTSNKINVARATMTALEELSQRLVGTKTKADKTEKPLAKKEKTTKKIIKSDSEKETKATSKVAKKATTSPKKAVAADTKKAASK